MPALNLKMNVEESGLESLAPLHQKHGTSDNESIKATGDLIHMADDALIEVGCLPRGMASGKTSVVFAFTLPDERVVLVETSLAVFSAAAQAFNARYETG